MKYSNSNKSISKKKQNIKSSYSREFAHKYDEIDKLVESIYSK